MSSERSVVSRILTVVLVMVVLSLLFGNIIPVTIEVTTIVNCTIREIGQADITTVYLADRRFDANTNAEQTCHTQYKEKYILTESKLIQLGQ